MITLKNVVLRRGVKKLLDSTSVTINPGEKVGLVGRNGAGKSSLFALFNGGLHEDSGEYSIPTQWRMAQVAQDMPETEQSATSFVVEGDIVLREAQLAVEKAEASGDGEALGHAYMELYDAGSGGVDPRGPLGDRKVWLFVDQKSRWPRTRRYQVGDRSWSASGTTGGSLDHNRLQSGDNHVIGAGSGCRDRPHPGARTPCGPVWTFDCADRLNSRHRRFCRVG